MNDYISLLEPYKNSKEISDLIDEIHKLREYYYTRQHGKLQEHITKLTLKYFDETISWNASHPITPLTEQQAYINAESFLRTKGLQLLLKNGVKLQGQFSPEEISFIESSIKPLDQESI